MAYLVVLVSLSGGGKSEVLDYVVENYSFSPMNSYTSRPPRFDGEGGYEFHDKQFFSDNEKDFVELATYPPHSDPKEENVHYYGKHSSQFDGDNKIMTMDEVGVLTLRKLFSENKLFDYQLITIFVTCDNNVRLERIGHDAKRDARDAKRKFLPLETYDYVVDNSGSKETLFAQVDGIFKKLV